MGGLLFLRAMWHTVGGQRARFPRRFLAGPARSPTCFKALVDGFPKGELTSPLWSKPVSKHRSWVQGRESPWSRVARGYEVPFARWCPEER